MVKLFEEILSGFDFLATGFVTEDEFSFGRNESRVVVGDSKLFSSESSANRFAFPLDLLLFEAFRLLAVPFVGSSVLLLF